jgi:2-dehydropantoate 2-reductase
MSGATSNMDVFPPIRKVCVFGAGAIGGAFAAKVAVAQVPGLQVSVVARGEHLRAIQTNGLTLDEPQGRVTARLIASEHPADLGPQDVVLLGLKSQQIPDVLPALKPLLAPHTVVLPAINGVPWWYFHADSSPKAQAVAAATQGAVLALDPQRQMFAALDPAHVVGCVVHAAAEVVGPGQIKGNGQHKYVIGEPSHQDSARVQALAALMAAQALDALAAQAEHLAVCVSAGS